MNLSILLIYLIYFGHKCEAQTVHCNYKAKNFYINGINSQMYIFYTCDLSSNYEIHSEWLTIEGQHQPTFNDDQVQLLHVLNDTNVESFSYILCSKFQNLKVIWTECEDIKSIDQSSFRYCGHLMYLEMSGSKIQEIPSGTFLFQNKLSELALGNNKIKNLYPNSFDNLENVKTLNLQSNEISNLPENVFGPLKSLQVLFLNDNKLTTIHHDSFGAHDNFYSISLAKNQINSIDQELIDKVEIRQLDIQGNICTASIFARTDKASIKTSLNQCFRNYRPRHLNGRPLMPVTLHTSVTEKPRGEFYKSSSSFVPMNFLKPDLNQNKSERRTNVCGKPFTGHGDIIGGNKISRGSFPWIAALVYSDSGKFFCGGSLISNQKVITAAHCIQEKHTSKPTLAREFLVLLGVHDLDKPFEAGRVSLAVQDVNLHPDWNTYTESFDADIAVLVLDSEVYFNNYIQPVCLVLPNTVIATESKAIVVGYGKSEDDTKVHENIPKVIETPIHTHQECFSFDDVLKRISSGRTICGGTGNGTGVCLGDSGSGLFVTDGNSFSIRGIVSSSVIGGRYGCDVDSYAVFTDITKYIDWINGIKTSRFN